MKKLLVKNIGLLATPEGKSAHRGEEQGKIKFLKDAWVLIEDGIIASVGTGAVPSVEGAEVVDAEGHLVTPGLVDAHTHLIFGGWRQNELGLKLHGASYLDIQNAGGGIQSTTNATRQASEQELAAKASKALDEMMASAPPRSRPRAATALPPSMSSRRSRSSRTSTITTAWTSSRPSWARTLSPRNISPTAKSTSALCARR